VALENTINLFLDQYYPRFAEYSGSEGGREEVYAQRLEVRNKLQAFVKNDFPLIIARIEDESQFLKVYEIFDLISRQSYPGGRQHYLSFFGAKRYYTYSEKKQEPPPEVSGRFQGTEIKDNIKKLYNLLTAERSQLPQYYEDFLKIPFVGRNLATAFLMYQNPKEFLMVNEKTFPLLDRLGIQRPRNDSFGEYDKLRAAILKIKDQSLNYEDGGFKDFLDLDWFEHLFGIKALEEELLFTGFTNKDFRRCTGKKPDAKYLQSRFKSLMEAVKPLLPPSLIERLWIPRINIQGTKDYRRSMWIGTSHAKYKNPRLGMQFQVYMRKEEFFAGIWGEGPARQTRNEAARRIKANSNDFIDLVNKLPTSYELRVENASPKTYKPGEFDQDKLNEFLQHLPEGGTYLAIGPWLTPEETVERKERILNFCADTIRNLTPLYSLITGREIQAPEPEGEKSPALISVEKVTAAHLLAGKNIVFYGPPGTGKTFLAKNMAKRFCKDNFLLRTGNAEWTAYDVVGGLGFSSEKGKTSNENPVFMLDFRRGFLTFAVQKADEESPCWLIIDEINRANLDLSFGKAFTLLDIDHRSEPLVDKDEYPSIPNAIYIPKSFRIIATMNSYDRAILFSLGFAFRRRFAFIELPSPFKHSVTDYSLDKENEQNWYTRMNNLVRDEAFTNIQRWIEDWIDSFSDNERLLFSSFPNFEKNLKETYGKMKSGAMDPYNPQAIMYSLAEEITKKGLVEFGFAQVVDGLKFVIAFLSLSSNSSTNLAVEAVDNAFLAYFIPQFEYILPDLRREKISGERQGIENTLEQVIQILDELGLKQSIAKLQLLKKEQKVF